MTLKPFSYRGLFLKPFSFDGETASGIIVQHHSKIATIYGRVTDVHPTCTNVAVGDWIVFLQNRPIRLDYLGGFVYWLDERDVLAVVATGDSAPWFAEKALLTA